MLQSDERALVAPLHSAVLGEKWWFLLATATYSSVSSVFVFLNFTVSVRSNFPVAVEKQYKMKSSATQ